MATQVVISLGLTIAIAQYLTPYCTIALKEMLLIQDEWNLIPVAFSSGFSHFRCIFSCIYYYWPQFMSILWQARFLTTVNHLRNLPTLQVPEVAFAGRSNAGKSTAINILCNQKKLCFASKTPGRTQHINYFSIGGSHVAQHRKDATIVEEIRALLVDLPGYGYAEVPGAAKNHWNQLLGDYVQRREQLSALILIMDSRRPFTDLDRQMLEWYAPTGRPVHCLLTKADKLNRNEATNALRLTNTVLASYTDEHGVPFPFTAQLFSSLKRIGIEEADAKIQELTGLDQPFIKNDSGTSEVSEEANVSGVDRP